VKGIKMLKEETYHVNISRYTYVRICSEFQ